jgi:hypothetical protein
MTSKISDKVFGLRIQDLKQIEYRKGTLERGMKPRDLPVKAWREARFLRMCAQR